MLQHPGNTGVPHGHREEILVGRVEPLEHLAYLLPGLALITLEPSARDQRHLGVDPGTSVDRRLIVPEVEAVDLEAGPMRSVSLEESLGELRGVRLGAPRR